jgi:hypothetical protein
LSNNSIVFSACQISCHKYIFSASSLKGIIDIRKYLLTGILLIKKDKIKLTFKTKRLININIFFIILLQINLLNKLYMKKLLFVLVVAGLAAFSACKSGPTKEQEAAKADSLAKVEETRIADSTAAAMQASEEAAKADSVAKAAEKK